MRKNFKFITLMLALVLSLTAAAFGQETSGAIEGTVTDTSGARVPGVTVTATGLDQGFSRTVKTDDEGFYRIQQVPPGQYRITTGGVSGFTDKAEDGVAVVLGRNTPVNFTLQASGATAEVTVTGADTPAIDVTTAGKIQTNIDQETLQLLPRGVGFASVLTVAPGVRAEPLSGGFQIDGASGSENTFILDGQEVTNFRTGTLNSNNNIPSSFVQEIQVKTSGFEAQFGGATGGVVNVVTRGGGNNFRGEFGVEFEPSKLQARGRQIIGASEIDLFYIQPQRAGGLNFFPSATLSGPIIPRHLWFFVSTAPQFLRTEQTFFTSGGQSITYESRERRDYTFARLDGQVMNNLRLSGTYTYNPLVRNGTFPTFNEIFALGNNISGATSPEDRAALGGRVPAVNVTGQAVFTPTSNLAINVRAGRGYLNEKINNYGIPNIPRIRCITAGPGCGAGFASIPPNFLTERDISIRKTFDVDATYLLSNFGGRHQFAGGYQRNAISNDVNEGYVGTGEVRLFYGRNFADNNGDARGVASGAAGYGYVQDFGTSGLASSVNEGIFIQDQWQPINRLTLNLGIRFERENVPSFSEAGVPIKFDFKDKIAPRFGFSYDVTGNSKFVIRGSFGRFFDRFKYELPRGSFGGDVFFRYYFLIPTGSTTPLAFTRAFGLANQFRTPLNFRVPSNSSDPDFNTVDPNLLPVRQTEYTIGAQFEVVKDLVLEVNYKRKKLDRTIEDVGVPDPVTGSETYFIANPGFGIVADSLIPGTPGTPKAQRQYDALEVNLNRRFTTSYYVNASYTYSRLFGNYGGLANSDEGGRTSPNVNRVFDLPFESFTASGVPNNGRLSTDRPHVFKLFTGYTVNYKEDSLLGNFGRFFGISSDHSTDLAVNFIAQSGTPISSRVDLIDVATVVLNERGDLGRTSFFTETGAALKHRYRFGRDGRFAIEGFINVLNVFNQANELARNDLISGAIFDESSFGLGSRVEAIQAIFSGNGVRDDIERLLDTEGFEIDARYNQPNLFQAPRRVRFGFRFIF